MICQKKTTNKLSPIFNPERLTTLRRKGATVTATNDRRTITRNVFCTKRFEVVNAVEERSDHKEKSVTNHNGNYAREHVTL